MDILSLGLSRLSLEHTQDSFLTTYHMVKENTKVVTKICFIKEAGAKGRSTAKVTKNI
jgi:hypothetical protein